MKWIGQHIWDFISRFRNDVYIENLSTTTEDELLVVDSNGKISKKNESTLVIDTSDLLLNSANNKLVTCTGVTDGSSATFNGEGNLTFDGTTLTLAGLIDMTSTIGIELASTSTTSDIIDVTCHTLTTGSFIELNQTDASTASATNAGLIEVNYAKSGVTGSGNSKLVTGMVLNVGDAATNHASSTVDMTGLDINAFVLSNTGTTSTEGICVSAVGADTNTGVMIKTTDSVSGDSSDIKIVSSADDADFFSIATGANGATAILTTGGGGNANLTIAANGTAELAGDTVTLDSAANIELEVGGVTSYINTAGIFRGSNIGVIQDGKIPISPTQFLAASYRFHPQYSLAGGGITMASASVNAYTEVIIPNGYTATGCTMYGTDVDNDSTIRCYSGSTVTGGTSALAAASTFSSGSVTHDFGANDVDGNGAVTVVIEWNPGDTVDVLFGGFISITKTT